MNAALILAFLVSPAMGANLRDGAASSNMANPIRKVVNLLKGMEKTVNEEAEKGKKLYEAYMCYCKNGAKDLEASMSAADSKIPAVGASIKEAEASLVQAKADLKSDQVARSEAKAAMAEATAIRDKEAAAYASEKAVYDTNIAAVAKAVGALEKGMGMGFLQTTAAQTLRKVALDKEDMLDSDRQMLLSFLSGTSSTEYVPSGGEVTGILKEMGSTMEKSLADATGVEKGAIESYDGLMSAKKEEVIALSASIEANTAKIGDLGVSIVQMKNDLSETEAGLLADKQFLADMDKECKAKEAEWAEAVKMRAQELAAIAETIKVLNDDDSLELFKKTLPSAAMSFVQTQKSAAVRARALVAIKKAQEADPSARAQYDFIALAIRGKTTGFEKVISLIDGMVSTLKKEQDDDAHKKEYCLGQFDVSDDKKKALEHSISDAETAIASATEGVATVKEEIEALAAGIKALDKSVAEATEQRKEESAEYTEIMASDTTAKELLSFAKNRLNKFYSPKLYKAPPKVELSAEGAIEASMSGTMPPTEAPGGIAGTGITLLAEVAEHTTRRKGADAPAPPPEAAAAYAKKSEESTGVITLIDMLIADLDKEMTEKETAEKDSQAEYEELMKDSAAKRAQDAQSLAERSSTQADLESDIQAYKDSKSSDTKSLMATLEYIQSLHSECDWLLKYYDVRKEARAGEVEALKEAKAVLSGADYSLVQTLTRVVTGRRS